MLQVHCLFLLFFCYSNRLPVLAINELSVLSSTLAPLMAAIGIAWWLVLPVGCASSVLLLRRGEVPGALMQVRFCQEWPKIPMP